MFIKKTVLPALLAASLFPTESYAESPTTRSLPPEVAFPEGLAASADGTLYVGSLTTGAIARYRPGASAADILLAPGELDRTAIGLTVDDARDLLWVCDASFDDPSGSALVGISLTDGRRVATHPLIPATAEAPVFCNDVSVDRRGHLFLTDSFGGRVLRVHRKDVLNDTPAETWIADASLSAVNDPPFGANGIFAGRRAIWVVNFNQGTLIRIRRRVRGRTPRVTVVPLFDIYGQPTTLIGPDGIFRERFDSFLVAENGLFNPAGNRLSRIELTRKHGQLIGTVIPLATGLNIPTTVTVTNGTAWVAEGQFDHLLGIDTSAPDPFQIVGIPVP